MYNIIDPYTQESFSLFSDKGKALLKKYIITYQIGGEKGNPVRYRVNGRGISFKRKRNKLGKGMGKERYLSTSRTPIPRARRSDKEQDFSCHKYIRRFFVIDDNGPNFYFVHQGSDTRRRLEIVLDIFNNIHNKFSLFTWQKYSSGTRVKLQTNGLRDYINEHKELILNPPELNDGNRKKYVEIIYTIIVKLHQLFEHPVDEERLKQQLYKLELAFKKLKDDGKLDKPIYSISINHYNTYPKSENGHNIGISSAYRIDVSIMHIYNVYDRPMTIFQELVDKSERNDLKRTNVCASCSVKPNRTHDCQQCMEHYVERLVSRIAEELSKIAQGRISFDYHKDAEYLFSHSFMICSDKCQPQPQQQFNLDQSEVGQNRASWDTLPQFETQPALPPALPPADSVKINFLTTNYGDGDDLSDDLFDDLSDDDDES